MSELESWIRLAKLESPRKAVALVDHFGGPCEVFEASRSDMMAVDGITPKTHESISRLADIKVDDEIDALLELNARVVTYKDPEYPINLRQIYDPPAVLFVRGELKEEDRFAVGIVGTRRPSEYGKSMAIKLSRELAQTGLTVVSGGARGIDSVAHSSALQTGRTVAVLGSGLNVPYPYENRGLFAKIAENGAVISEFAPGTKPEAWRFPVRNRLISGLALGILVIESKVAGGAMITATLAAEQGRDVWAVPGATDNLTSGGPHRLIKEGAKLVESAEDILEELGLRAEARADERPTIPSNLTAEQKSILTALTLHPKHVDEILAECKLTSPVVNSTLTLLEMQGLVRRVPGNAYVRAL